MPVLPAPLPLAGADLSGIREIGTLLDCAVTMSRLLPRGKGAVPRFLGRALLSPRKNYFVTKHGGRIVIDPGNLDVFVSMRQAGNSWDYHDFRICHDLVLDGQIFYDIGANVGYFSIEMLAITRCKVAVVSFEPYTELAEAIRLSADISGHSNLTMFNAMVGDRSGQADFYLAPSSIHASAVADLGVPQVGKSSKPMVALDDLVSVGAAAAPDVVKADIEGSEHLLFAGAHRLFREQSPHIFIRIRSGTTHP